MNKNSSVKKCKVELLVLAIIVQLFLNIFINAYNLGNTLFGESFKIPSGLVILLNILFSVLAIYLIINILALSKKEKELDILQNEVKHNENLLAFLREIKHDVNNQLFVVTGLMQMGKSEQAATYYAGINQQFKWMEDLLELNQPAVAALVLDKLIVAKNQDISVKVQLDVKFVSSVSVEVLTRILGNLLDNAIEFLIASKEGSKTLVFEVKSKEDYLVISIGNTGTISKEVSEKMFNRGFSTKKDKEGHGLGLYIVHSLMESIGGKIIHRNDAGMTYFDLNFPR